MMRGHGKTVDRNYIMTDEDVLLSIFHFMLARRVMIYTNAAASSAMHAANSALFQTIGCNHVVTILRVNGMIERDPSLTALNIYNFTEKAEALATLLRC